MRNKGQLILGGSVLIFGFIFLIGNLLDISIWRFVWPLLLIGLGVLIIFRQGRGKGDTEAYFAFARDIKPRGELQVGNAEYWHFAGDVIIDFAKVTIPEGEHFWKFYGFVHELRLNVPPDVGVAVSTNAFITEKKIGGDKEDLILVPLEWKSAAYDTAPNKLHIEATGFVVEVRVKEVDSEPTIL